MASTPEDLVSSVATSPPVSFTYGGQPSAELLAHWRKDVSRRGVGESTAREVVYTDPATALEVVCEVRSLPDFRAVEWVLRFRNNGDRDTPIIEDVQTLDAVLRSASGSPYLLRYARGGIWADRAFEPLSATLEDGQPLVLSPRREQGVAPTDYAPAAGLSSCPYLPFFNLDARTEGAIVAIGWTGQWQAQFTRVGSDGTTIRVGLERTHFLLHPGEEVRLPRVLLLPWQGDFIDGQNVFRRLLLTHYTPQRDGKPLAAPTSFTNWGAEPAESHLRKIALIRDAGLPVDVVWIDGGWTVGNRPWSLGLESDSIPVWSQNVGNWRASTEMYPDGIRPIGDAVRAAGMKLVLWLETVRVYTGTEVAHAKPEWLLAPGPEVPEAFAGSQLFDLTQPEAVEWLADLACRVLEECGVDYLWNDFCIDDPLSYWRRNEARDRQGIREIRWVEGYLRLWDELLRRRPGMTVINCAGGGRQIDLDTMKRSLPLWTSDYQAVPSISGETPTGDQCHSFGSLFWLPISATACMTPDILSFRSNMRASVNVRWWLNQELPAEAPVDWLKTMLEQHRMVRPYYYGDYYPLTEYSLEESVWMAYQMHREDLDEGMVLAFRRAENAETQRRFRLRGLSPDREYRVRSLDTGEAGRWSGGQLMAEGLQVTIGERPGSDLMVYGAGDGDAV